MSSYLLKGGLVATFTTDGPRTHKADVLVEGSSITKIAENIPHVKSGMEVIDCSNKWITPGFVDTHRHIWMTVLRGSQDDWLLTEYLLKSAWTLQPSITPEEVRIGQFTGCLDAIHSGVTTLLDHFHTAHTAEHHEAALEATIKSGARVILCPARQSSVTQISPELRFDNDAEVSKVQISKLKEWGAKDGGKLTEDGRVLLGLAYDVVAPGDPTVHQEIFKIARSIPVAIITAHVVQGPRIFHYRDAGLLGPDIVLSHCNELYTHTKPNDEMWATMKNYQCAISATPVDELGMAHGLPVAFEAFERGVKCGLGADATSINGGDLFQQMRTALQFHRGRMHEKIRNDDTAAPLHNKFNSADAFRLATLGGAEALNLSHIIGTIEEGKKADIVIYDALSANLAGIRDPFQGIVFHASNADIETVLINGEVLKRHGKLTKVDWPSVAAELHQTAEGIRARLPDDVLENKWKEFYAACGGPTEWVK